MYVHKRNIGGNAFGEPMYNETYEEIENVLVAPVNVSDIQVEITDPTKRREMLTLAIPKGDAHDWEDARIIYKGKRYRTVGIPDEGIEELIPLRWHKKVTIERYG